MAHQWHRGILESSSWHGLEEVGAMPTAESMIDAGERSGAWPVALKSEPMATVAGLPVPGSAMVALYREHPAACLGVVGDRYRATATQEWRDLVRAAVCAGARPTGAFSLREGSRALATFEVGTSNGLRTNLLIADSYDGSMSLTCGTSSIRVVCANTMSAAMTKDGLGMAKIRHTASLEQKVNILAESIGIAIAQGEKVRSAYNRAEETRMSRASAQAAFDLLFPDAPEGATTAAKTRAANARQEAMVAAAMPINNAGPTLATLWNAATYLVDRRADGSARPVRSGSALDSMLFGARSERVQEIQKVVEIVMRDGTVQPMTIAEALEAGVSSRQLAEQIIADAMS